MKKLDLHFYAADAVTVAQQLIGCYLVRDSDAGRIIGRINEVEAYISTIDKASHAWGNKRTVRNEPMFRTGGIAHVYFIYGMYNCLNVVTGPDGDASAVLIRGVEIVSGTDIAAQNRHDKDFADLSRAQQKNLSNGPGKLCRALNIDRTFDFHPLTGEELYICEAIETFDKTVTEIAASKRIGIDYAEEAVDFLWRFTG
ncbi:DNA-3-methyladenine glycosylase [Kluyvera sp. STS39-E]|uniref:DNA-3-methyladenine glycosylase n=1 Tax=Kluyvera sp. STS39-E TaxID=3234748 RepID=UPI0034C64C00